MPLIKIIKADSKFREEEYEELWYANYIGAKFEIHYPYESHRTFPNKNMYYLLKGVKLLSGSEGIGIYKDDCEIVGGTKQVKTRSVRCL